MTTTKPLPNPNTGPLTGDPRVAGGRYQSGYWGDRYTVLDIQFDEYGWLRSITERDEKGTVRTHRTHWDPRRDKILVDPRELADVRDRIAKAATLTSGAMAAVTAHRGVDDHPLGAAQAPLLVPHLEAANRFLAEVFDYLAETVLFDGEDR